MIKKILFKLLSNDIRMTKRILKLNTSSTVTILNFHRVSPYDGSLYRPLDPLLFDEILVFLKRNFEIILFSQIDEAHDKPKLIISFDDGYLDFLEYAVPVLEKHKLKVNQNIIPQCIATNKAPINVWVQDFIGTAPNELLLKLPLPFKVCDHKITNKLKFAYEASRSLKNLPAIEFYEWQSCLYNFFDNYSEFTRAKVLNIKQLKDLSTEHEIGIHSFEHFSMEFQTDEYFKTDLKMCLQFIKENPWMSNIYAFPNGSITEEKMDIIKDFDFKHILLVGDKFSSVSNTIHNRFTFDALTLSEAKYKALGRTEKINI